MIVLVDILMLVSSLVKKRSIYCAYITFTTISGGGMGIQSVAFRAILARRAAL
jgi:hypothetical protein